MSPLFFLFIYHKSFSFYLESSNLDGNGVLHFIRETFRSKEWVYAGRIYVESFCRFSFFTGEKYTIRLSIFYSRFLLILNTFFLNGNRKNEVLLKYYVKEQRRKEEVWLRKRTSAKFANVLLRALKSAKSYGSPFWENTGGGCWLLHSRL